MPNCFGQSLLVVLSKIHGTRTDLQLEKFLCVNFSHFLPPKLKDCVGDKGKKRKYINESWAGKVPSSIAPHYGTGRDVRDVRVNEAAGYIFTSSFRGSLCVTNLATGEDLWSLPLVSTLVFQSGPI